jgi:carbamoyltransferase
MVPGKMEFGPRSLGARSILGDARSPEMQKILNLKVKYRESFRPFAPAILAENISEWFDFSGDSPYMLMVAPVKKSKTFPMSEHQQALFGIDRLNVVRSEIPAVTHVDYSARLQTVHKSTNPLFSKLINKFNVLTGVPILVNTSFNVRGEPIVCSPEDAFRCFMGTELDGLAIGSFYCEKNEQVVNREMYEHDYELD